MSGIPGSRVGGIGPAPVVYEFDPTDRGPIRMPIGIRERPEHAACRQRTPEEDAAVRAAVDRRSVAKQLDRLISTFLTLGAPIAHRRTCTDPTCFCDWSQP